MRQNHKEILEQFLEKDGFQAEIIIDNISWVLWNLLMTYFISLKISSVEEINIKNLTCHLFDGIININNIDPNKIRIDEQSYKNILIY